jgi:hypothetical protein
VLAEEILKSGQTVNLKRLVKRVRRRFNFVADQPELLPAIDQAVQNNPNESAKD